jgi:acyl carrier protein
MIPNEVKIDAEGLAERLVKDVHAELKAALRGADLWDSLDYFEISMAMQKRANALFPSFEWLSCAPVTSAGHHYIYVGTVFKGRHNLIFVGKTSKGFQAACEVANMCARELRA